MKKTLGFYALFLLTFSLAGAAVITVNRPTGKVPYIWNATDTITWTKSGDMPVTVRISLRNPDTLAEVKLIKDGAENSGTYSWKVSPDVTPGLYRVRVKAVGAAVQGDSEVFVVGSATPTLTVNQPDGTCNWKTTKTYQISWANTNPLSDTVKVAAYQDGFFGSQIVIKENYPNAGSAGSCPWTVPANLTAGKYYVSVFNTHATKVDGTSPLFTISIGIIVPNPPLTKKK